jgi:DNA replication protein DnaC
MQMIPPISSSANDLRERAEKLRLYGLCARWGEWSHEPWVAQLIGVEEQERARRSHDYRISKATIGRFKAMADFDWKHPTGIDRAQIQDLMSLGFLADATNVVFVGPNAVGKTMIAKNIAHQAVIRGHSTRFVVASDMLNDLSSYDGSAFRLRLKRYVAPELLVIDELGYLRYDNRFADILFEVVRKRYDNESSIILTTNKGFGEWNQVFESAACLVTLIDRLCHRSEIVQITGESYRLKEALEASADRTARRKKSRPASR